MAFMYSQYLNALLHQVANYRPPIIQKESWAIMHDCLAGKRFAEAMVTYLFIHGNR